MTRLTGPPPPWRRSASRRLLHRVRRPLAVALLAAAAGLGTHVATASPAPGTAVVVAARDLPAGHRLAVGDLTRVRLPAGAVPARARSHRDDVAGHRLAAPVRRGEPVTDVRLRGPGALAAAPPGTVATTVPVPDPLTGSLLQAGDRVDLLAAEPLDPTGSGPARTVATRAVVLEVHRPGADLLAAADPQPLALLALPPEQARAVAGAQAGGPLTLVLRP